MYRKLLLVTNNPKAIAAYKNRPSLVCHDLEDYLAVLVYAREQIELGFCLLSHPQASNLKPGQSPYKSILLGQGFEIQDKSRDRALIEASIGAYEKFTRGFTFPNWPAKTLADFQTVDLAVLDSVFSRPAIKAAI